jgi:NAD(P)-dependent dehydrogenase (short-subunit alcohol dehydrogenase family)
VNDPFADPGWIDLHTRFSADFQAGLAMIARHAFHSIGKTIPMISTLEGKTVVVIGGSNGIGAAVAELAQAEGATVLAISRTGRASRGVKGVAADVADHEALASAFEAVGVIDHLIHTVGARLGSPALTSLSDDILATAFETKLFSAIHTARLALPYLSPEASITFTSGQVSRKYGVGSLVKGTVNAAVDAAGRHLAKELAPRRVNVISPGVVDTSLWGEAGSDARAATIARVSNALPVKRVGVPAELAQAYLFVMTNGFVTGALIDVDGGGLL